MLRQLGPSATTYACHGGIHIARARGAPPPVCDPDVHTCSSSPPRAAALDTTSTRVTKPSIYLEYLCLIDLCTTFKHVQVQACLAGNRVSTIPSESCHNNPNPVGMSSAASHFSNSCCTAAVNSLKVTRSALQWGCVASNGFPPIFLVPRQVPNEIGHDALGRVHGGMLWCPHYCSSHPFFRYPVEGPGALCRRSSKSYLCLLRPLLCLLPLICKQPLSVPLIARVGLCLFPWPLLFIPLCLLSLVCLYLLGYLLMDGISCHQGVQHLGNPNTARNG